MKNQRMLAEAKIKTSSNGKVIELCIKKCKKSKKSKKIKKQKDDISFVSAMFTVADLQAIKPDWTKRQCVDFLRDYSKEIANAMIEAGGDVLVTLLSPDNDVDVIDADDDV